MGSNSENETKVYDDIKMAQVIIDIARLSPEQYLQFMKDVMNDETNRSLYKTQFELKHGRYGNSDQRERCQAIALAIGIEFSIV